MVIIKFTTSKGIQHANDKISILEEHFLQLIWTIDKFNKNLKSIIKSMKAKLQNNRMRPKQQNETNRIANEIA